MDWNMLKTRHYHRASKDTEPDRPQKGLTGRKRQIALEDTALRGSQEALKGPKMI